MVIGQSEKSNKAQSTQRQEGKQNQVTTSLDIILLELYDYGEWH